MSQIKTGVSLYSYQQAQFFKQLNVWEQIREVREGLGTDGIEIISEQAIRHYPFPSDAWMEKWLSTMEKYDMNAVAYDPHLDVLQFRDHVMDYDEAADRLKRDIRLAKKMGFKMVRTHISHKFDIILKALPLAEELDIPLATEVHAPMSLQGPEVTDIVEHCERTGCKHLGIIPDFGLFQTKPHKPMTDWYIRKGAKPETVDLALQICDDNVMDQIDDNFRSLQNQQYFTEYVNKGDEPPSDVAPKIFAYVDYIKSHLKDLAPIDWDLLSWPIRLLRCTGKELEDLASYVFSCHGKFYGMTEIPGRPGEYEDTSIDYITPIEAMKKGGFNGYINVEYEGQRYAHDMDLEHYSDDVEEVRRCHGMFKRLI